MPISEELRLLIARKTDDELYAYFASADGYVPEALEAVRNEIRKRGLPDDQLDQLAFAAREDAAGKTFAFKGCGTSLYGKCDFRGDGSYITTKWITFLYWPIVPLRSLRISATEGERVEVLELLQMHWRQVSRIYGFVFWLLASVPLAIWVGEKYSFGKESYLLVLAGISIPFGYLYWSRANGRKKCLATFSDATQAEKK